MQSPLTLARLSLARLIRGWWTATGVRASGAGVAGVGSVGTGAGWATVLRMTTARLGLAGLSLREWGFAELSLLRLSLARLNWARTGDLGRVAWPPAWLAAERTQLVLWLPVLMGAGVLTYFALHKEPPVWIGAVLLAPALAGAWLAWPGSVTRGALVALTAFALGLTTVQFATWRVAPLLVLPTHAVVVTGVVRQVDLLPSGRRLLLEAVRLDGAEQPLARAVRVRLRTNDPIAVATGDTVRVRALLRVPAAPAYPGGWDLQRDAFFSGLGGSGFALGSATLVAAGSPTGLVRWIQLLRERIGTHFIQGMPGAAGTIAATLFTGNSGAIPVEDHDAFRASGLAHLLAVAGLHIGIVMGWTMLLTRVVLALCEYTALRWPTKQIGAFVALAAGGG